MLRSSLRLELTLPHVLLESVQVLALSGTNVAEQVVVRVVDRSRVAVQQGLGLEHLAAHRTNLRISVL